MKCSALLVGVATMLGLAQAIPVPEAVVNIAPISGGLITGSVGRQTRASRPNGDKTGEISVFVHNAPVAGTKWDGCGPGGPENGAAISGAVIHGCLISNSGPISGGTILGNNQAADIARGVHNSGPISGGVIGGNVGRVARAVTGGIVKAGSSFNSLPISGETIQGDLGRMV